MVPLQLLAAVPRLLGLASSPRLIGLPSGRRGALQPARSACRRRSIWPHSKMTIPACASWPSRPCWPFVTRCAPSSSLPPGRGVSPARGRPFTGPYSREFHADHELAPCSAHFPEILHSSSPVNPRSISRRPTRRRRANGDLDRSPRRAGSDRVDAGRIQPAVGVSAAPDSSAPARPVSVRTRTRKSTLNAVLGPI